MWFFVLKMKEVEKKKYMCGGGLTVKNSVENGEGVLIAQVDVIKSKKLVLLLQMMKMTVLTTIVTLIVAIVAINTNAESIRKHNSRV